MCCLYLLFVINHLTLTILMNHTSPKLPIHAGFAYYVKLVNPANNPTKHPLYTQTVFSRAIRSDKLTTTSDFYTMTSVNYTTMSVARTMASADLTLKSDKFTMTPVAHATPSVRRTTSKYLFALHFNFDNRQLSTGNSPL
ncbi:hypothetical protein Palpr_1676 [Paludibacter propionicigenes WB4]|uniref:Uncharacterized protein n=1 Tax=Paludibacter propionicigenes (strain DSM 17365 / JCM 13257 / WB4) TaxID=694427 RepID=E4T523_PALPW|nr:hypothetical protein Palpr_1676 [Paludibacter propionicigenes WB4]